MGCTGSLPVRPGLVGAPKSDPGDEKTHVRAAEAVPGGATDAAAVTAPAELRLGPLGSMRGVSGYDLIGRVEPGGDARSVRLVAGGGGYAVTIVRRAGDVYEVTVDRVALSQTGPGAAAAPASGDVITGFDDACAHTGTVFSARALSRLVVARVLRPPLPPRVTGQLEKKGARYAARHQTRLFTLSAAVFSYEAFAPVGEVAPEITIPLGRGAAIVDDGGVAFRVCTPSRDYKLRAGSVSEKCAWVYALRCAAVAAAPAAAAAASTGGGSAVVDVDANTIIDGAAGAVLALGTAHKYVPLSLVGAAVFSALTAAASAVPFVAPVVGVLKGVVLACRDVRECRDDCDAVLAHVRDAAEVLATVRAPAPAADGGDGGPGPGAAAVSAIEGAAGALRALVVAYIDSAAWRQAVGAAEFREARDAGIRRLDEGIVMLYASAIGAVQADVAAVEARQAASDDRLCVLETRVAEQLAWAAAAPGPGARAVSPRLVSIARLKPGETRLVLLRRWVEGTRLWLLDAIARWWHGGVGADTDAAAAAAPRRPARMLWLSGDAGVGKSSISSRIAGQLDAAALHFCQHYDPASRDVYTVVSSLAAQLQERLGDAGYAPDDALLQRSGGDTPDAVFQRVIAAPLAALAAPPADPVLIVIDGLDEAVDPATGCNEILEMLSAADRAPAWLRFVVSSRRVDAIGRALGQYGLALESSSDANLADLRRVLSAEVGRMRLGEDTTQEAAVSVLLHKSSGSFYYVKFVREMVAATRAGGAAVLSREFIDETPDDLLKMLGDSMARVYAAVPRDAMQPLLEVLVAAAEPLPLSVVREACTASGAAAPVVDRGLYALLDSALYLRQPDTRLVPFHRLVYDYLVDARNGGVDVSAGHARLALWSRAHIFGSSLPATGASAAAPSAPAAARDCDPERPGDAYAFRHHIAHVLGGGRGGHGGGGGEVAIPHDAWLAGAFTDAGFIDGTIRVGGGPAIVRQIRAAAPRGLTGVPPFAAFVSETAHHWGADLLGALAPAMSGRYGPDVAQRMRAWAGRRLPSCGGVRCALSPAVPWAARSTAPVITLYGHTAACIGVCVSPDGGEVITCGWMGDGSIRRHDAVSGETLSILPGHERRGSNCVMYLGDGRSVVSQGMDGRVMVWAAAAASGSAAERTIVVTNGRPLFGMAVVPRTGVVVVHSPRLMGGDGSTSAWSAHTGEVLQKQIATPCGDDGGINFGMDASPDGALLALAGGAENGTCAVFDAAAWTLQRTLRGHTHPLVACAFAGDSRRLLTGSRDATARVWDATTGASLAVLTGHGGMVMGLAWSRDPASRLLMTGATDATARVWSSTSYACLRQLTGHAAYVTGVAFFPGNARVATACFDSTVRLWDIPELGDSAPGRPDTPGAAAAAAATAPQQPGDEPWAAPPGPQVFAVCLSRDARHVFVGGSDCSLRLCDARTGAAVAAAVPVGAWAVCAVAVSHAIDGGLVACGDDGGCISLWDWAGGGTGGTAPGTPMRSWQAHVGDVHGRRVRCVAFAPDDTQLASASDAHTAAVWDVRTGTRLWEVAPPPPPDQGGVHAVCSLAYSPDGNKLVAAVGDTTVRLWDAASGAELAMWRGHDTFVVGCAWSPDGAAVGSGSADRSVIVWDVASGRHMRMARRHMGTVRAVAFAPGPAGADRRHRRLASGAIDGSVALHDASTGACLAYAVLPSPVWTLAWRVAVPGAADVLFVGFGFTAPVPFTHLALVTAGVTQREWARGVAASHADTGTRCCSCVHGPAPARSHECCCCGAATCERCSSTAGAVCGVCSGPDASREAHARARSAGLGGAAAAGPGTGDVSWVRVAVEPAEAEAVRRFLEQAIPRATSDVIAAYSAALEGEGVRSKEDLLELPDDVVDATISRKLDASKVKAALANRRRRGGGGGTPGVPARLCDICAHILAADAESALPCAAT